MTSRSNEGRKARQRRAYGIRETVMQVCQPRLITRAITEGATVIVDGPDTPAGGMRVDIEIETDIGILEVNSVQLGKHAKQKRLGM